MKKFYESPEAEIEKFDIEASLITTSGFNGGSDTGEDVDDSF